MSALSCKNPTTLNATFASMRYSISITSSINPQHQLVVGGCVTFQRCSIDSNGLYTDDPTPGSCQTYGIGDLTAFAVANPQMAPLIQAAWSELDAFVAEMNSQFSLV